MRLRSRILVLYLALLVLSGTSSSTTAPSADTGTGKYIAYYFHTTTRCSTCLKIEEQARQVIETEFADQLQSGQLEWKVVDVQLPENRHFVQDFQLLTKSLVIVEQKDGKPGRFKILDKVWELVLFPDRYNAYVREEVGTFTGTH